LSRRRDADQLPDSPDHLAAVEGLRQASVSVKFVLRIAYSFTGL
jgi:hypothetical protein